VFLNAILGYVQQERAESAIAALRQMSAAHAHVVRDGEPTSVPATDFVPAEILIAKTAIRCRRTGAWCTRSRCTLARASRRHNAALLPFLSAV
jgi:hypothetical protein